MGKFLNICKWCRWKVEPYYYNCFGIYCNNCGKNIKGEINNCYGTPAWPKMESANISMDDIFDMYEECKNNKYIFDTIFIAPWWKKLWWRLKEITCGNV